MCSSDLLIVRSWPLELVNGAPMDPAKTAGNVERLRSTVAIYAFRRFDPAVFPTSTLPALALTSRAYRQSTKTGLDMAFAVRNALFEEGRNVADPAVLASLADRFGTGMPDDSDAATVLADYHEGQRRGVIGSPHFFCAGEQGFCPSLDITRDPEHGMSITFNAAAISEFLDRCLAALG